MLPTNVACPQDAPPRARPQAQTTGPCRIGRISVVCKPRVRTGTTGKHRLIRSPPLPLRGARPFRNHSVRAEGHSDCPDGLAVDAQPIAPHRQSECPSGAGEISSRVPSSRSGSEGNRKTGVAFFRQTDVSCQVFRSRWRDLARTTARAPGTMPAGAGPPQTRHPSLSTCHGSCARNVLAGTTAGRSKPKQSISS